VLPQVIRAADDPWEIGINDLEMGRILGEGAYGSVCQVSYLIFNVIDFLVSSIFRCWKIDVRCLQKATYHGNIVAVKRMKAELLKPQDIAAFKKEAKLMKTLSAHPNGKRTTINICFLYR
jgi:serine/threonine protein kinase